MVRTRQIVAGAELTDVLLAEIEVDELLVQDIPGAIASLGFILVIVSGPEDDGVADLLESLNSFRHSLDKEDLNMLQSHENLFVLCTFKDLWDVSLKIWRYEL